MIPNWKTVVCYIWGRNQYLPQVEQLVLCSRLIVGLNRRISALERVEPLLLCIETSQFRFGPLIRRPPECLPLDFFHRVPSRRTTGNTENSLEGLYIPFGHVSRSPRINRACFGPVTQTLCDVS
ncbi:hypothetical protein AMECASPLE_029742 [Ameca splendens]|uniref:Uncharacterized protein n=1 Tax=Ameca splendens TaxID=208324 RepID=A0ABV0YU62_9TELE